MLECRTYSYAELSALLHTRDRQGIVRRFERWEVKYTTTGRGTGQKFAITEIGNPFKVYCILDLGFSPQTDFTKLAFFTYYLLCDDEFQQLPSAQMEEYLRADGHTLSRQTISNYLLCLEAASLVCRGFDYLYYFAFGEYHKDTDEITYKRAWSEHWERIQQGWPSSESIVQMRMDYGGVARKHPLLIFSAFFNPMYGQIIDWALEAMNVDLGKSD